jgi:hypothetical protein
MGTEAHMANMHSPSKHGYGLLIMSKALCCNSAAYLIAGLAPREHLCYFLVSISTFEL